MFSLNTFMKIYLFVIKVQYLFSQFMIMIMNYSQCVSRLKAG